LEQPNQKGNSKLRNQNLQSEQTRIYGRQPVESLELEGTMDIEPPFAPSAWLSIYNEKP